MADCNQVLDGKRKLIFSILNFLNDEINSDKFDSDSKESLEVAAQCLENVYNVSSTNPEDRKALFTSTPLESIFKQHLIASQKPVSAEDKAKAEQLKNEGNDLMKVECYADAIEKYSQAIKTDPHNAVYYSNRAAAHSKMGNHNIAIDDCEFALGIDDSYSKAYGRMGLAYTELKQFTKAIDCYKQALHFDPSNDSYKNNLKVAQEMLAKSSNPPTGPTLGGIDLNNLSGGGLGGLSSVLNNENFMQMATNLMSNPQVMNAFTSAMQQNSGGAAAPGGAGGAEPPNMNAFLQMGQRLAEQIEREDPEQVARLREQFGAAGAPPQPPPNQDGSYN